ncbi:hypothetical protein ACJX0J_029393, partial [Zea mays]
HEQSKHSASDGSLNPPTAQTGKVHHLVVVVVGLEYNEREIYHVRAKETLFELMRLSQAKARRIILSRKHSAAQLYLTI